MPSPPEVASPEVAPPAHPRHLRLPLRALAILALCVAVVLLLSVDSVNAGLHRLLAAAEPTIASHPVSGLLLFVALSALSAV